MTESNIVFDSDVESDTCDDYLGYQISVLLIVQWDLYTLLNKAFLHQAESVTCMFFFLTDQVFCFNCNTVRYLSWGADECKASRIGVYVLDSRRYI